MQMPTQLKIIIGLQSLEALALALGQRWPAFVLASLLLAALLHGGNTARKFFYGLACLSAGGNLVMTFLVVMTLIADGTGWMLLLVMLALTAFAIWKIAVFGSHEVETWYRFGRHETLRPART